MKNKLHIVGQAVPNLPWEPRPAGNDEQVWRYSGNPIIDRHPIPCAQAIYNSAVLPYDGRFVGVFRTDYKSRMPYLHMGWSPDGLRWQIEPERIRFDAVDPEIGRMEYAYDPRLTQIGDTYYIQWCNGYHGPTIGLARTRDFKTFEQLENAFLPYKRLTRPPATSRTWCFPPPPSATRPRAASRSTAVRRTPSQRWRL